MRFGRTYGSMAIPVKTQNTPDVETLSASNSSPIIEAAFSASTSNLIELANTIKRETERLDRYIKDSNLPEPSFDVDAPLTFTKLPDELKKAREEVMRATKELGTLVTALQRAFAGWRGMLVSMSPYSVFIIILTF